MIVISQVSFTGSTETGRKIMQAAALSNLKPVYLELGGKSPVLIFDDADIDKAVDLALFGILHNKVNFLPWKFCTIEKTLLETVYFSGRNLCCILQSFCPGWDI